MTSPHVTNTQSNLNKTGTNSESIELKFTSVTFKCRKKTGRPGRAPVSVQPRTGTGAQFSSSTFDNEALRSFL